MALFGTKDKKKETAAAGGAAQAPSRMANATALLKNPRVTEKATNAALASTYVFDVAPSATKRDIAVAVASLYKVTPRKVAIVSVLAKNIRNARTGIRGVKGGGKKAYVYLKKGETISIA